MEIRSFVTALANDAEHPVLDAILHCVDAADAPLYTELFAQVSAMLLSTMPVDADGSVFKVDYLRNVIKQFSDDVAIQDRQRKVLESIRRYAITHCQMTAAEIPALIKIKHDAPAIAPTVMFHSNMASRLFSCIKAELEYPEKLSSNELEIGRLAAVLFCFEGVADFSKVAGILQHSTLCYVDNVVLLRAEHENFTGHRMVVQPYTALLLQLYWRQRDIQSSKDASGVSKRLVLKCVNSYIQLISNNTIAPLRLSDLTVYRKLFWASRFSPVESALYLQRYKSTSLPDTIFYRVLTDKSLQRLEVGTSTQLNISLSRALQALNMSKQQQSATYHNAGKTIKLVQHLISLVKKPSTDDLAGLDQNILKTSKHKLHQAVAMLIGQQLQQAEYSNNYFAQLLGQYLIYMLKNGGEKKNKLKLVTIRDYVSAPLKAFVTIFNDTELSQMDADQLTEKLNDVAEQMAKTKVNCLYYLARYLERLALVDGFLASSIDVLNSESSVDANIISVPQAEYLLQYLFNAGEQYYDAILLFCLGFYSGTRRAEAKYIRVSDFERISVAGGEQISVKIFPTQKRNLKSSAANRVLVLNVYWPKQWLTLLSQKLQLMQAAGFSKSDLLFDADVEQNFAFVSQLLRDYLNDETFRYHNLRHSFVCWQYFRLVVQQRLPGEFKPGIRCLAHDYFSDEACQTLRTTLGLASTTRKSVYALCAQVGHSEPKVTFGSYFHLRELYQSFLIADHLRVTQKALSRLVGRARLDPQKLTTTPASAISYSSPVDRQNLKISTVPNWSEYLPLQLTQQGDAPAALLPSLKQLERGIHYIGKLQSDECIAIEDGSNAIKIDGSWLSKLSHTCYEVKQLPRMPKNMSLLPIIPRSAGQLRADKKLSVSRVIFDIMLHKTQHFMDSAFLTDGSIIAALESLSGLLKNELWELQFTEPMQCSAFLELAGKLLPTGISVSATLCAPDDVSAIECQRFYGGWYEILAQHHITPQQLSIESVAKDQYWSHKLTSGIVQIHFVISDAESLLGAKNTYKRGAATRTSAVMHFLHFLLIACKTRVMLKTRSNLVDRVE
ncbi:hypothetical protein [Rheinheimera aquimaris]|uniref:hypothetical protein n=1 Tax=Rheinheimera aquimaris TaxID=412437 RepID=UPI0010661871|nr:hypothetical protein [Rheinheimera aquimaris]